MRNRYPSRAALTLLMAAALPAAAQFPLDGEVLNYTINWPSGLSLGEAHLSTRRHGNRWRLEFTVDAAMPGFPVADRYRSLTTEDLCSLEFEKEFVHGLRKTREKTTFDARRNVARRATVNGGKTDYPMGACARDALAFVFHTRGELAQGRMPSESTVFFGAPYQVKLDYTGARRVRVNEKAVDAECMQVSVKGPAAGLNFEMCYASDAVRTPLLVKVPFPPGVFSMELVR